MGADIRDAIEDVHVLSLPMATKFRGITSREVMIFRGPAGWAEFSPFLEYGVVESSRWLAAALEFAGVRGPLNATEPARDFAEVNATLPACAESAVASVLERFGVFGTVKAKIAEHGIDSLDDDVARLREFRRLYPETILRVDANAGYSVDEALQAGEALALFGLQYMEQPVASVEDMVAVREGFAQRGLPVVLAADESIRKAEDPLRVAQLGAAEVVIIKVQPLGGIAAALDVVRRSGLPAVVSSALESSVGLAAGVELATRLPRTERSIALLGENPACGLATASLFEADVAMPGLRAVGGRLPRTRIEPQADQLSRLAVSPGRTQWWTRRLELCWSHLGLEV